MAKKRYSDDDGRVIAPMNVPGMPWYQEHAPDAPERAQREELSREQTLRAVGSATLAGLVVVLVFSLGLVALVAFLLWAWR